MIDIFRKFSFTGFSHSRPRERQEMMPVKLPSIRSETRSLSEHFSGLDAFESQVVGSKTTALRHMVQKLADLALTSSTPHPPMRMSSLATF